MLHRLLQSRLPVFIILSLCIHLVWFIGQNNLSLSLPMQQDQQISARIKSPAPTKPTQEATSEQLQSNKPAQTQASASSEQAANSQSASEFNSARVLSRIKQKMSEQFRYPPLARKQGWQGKVVLAFRIDRDGSINTIQLKHSSGYAVLDQSAMAALSRIGNINMGSTQIPNTNQQFELPVIYRLEG